MDLKKEIEKILDSLKKVGWSRGRIEQELDYSENYLDQQLSKGGNERILKRLKKLESDVLQKAIPDQGVNTLLPLGEIKTTVADYINLLTDYNNLLKSTILNVELKVSTIETNLNKGLGGLSLFANQMYTCQDVILKSLSRLEKKPEGTLKKEADILAEQRMTGHKPTDTSKPKGNRNKD